MRKIIKLKDLAGTFGEDKDIARAIRTEKIIPAIENKKDVVLDFSGMTGATQSFIHALIAEPIMRFKETAFSHLIFKDSNDNISEIISIVYRYLQESFDSSQF